MAKMNHPFVLKLIGTFQDNNQLYMLLEIVMGGELWSLLYSKNILQRTGVGGIREVQIGGSGWSCGGVSLKSASN